MNLVGPNNAREPGCIAIVDDEPAQVEVLLRAVEMEGYCAIGFTESSEFLKAQQKVQFDLLVVDLHMPGVDGIAIIEAALKVDPQLVPIVMTGHATVEIAVQAMKSGALDFLLKPLNMSVIRPVISKGFALHKLRLENEALQRGLRSRTEELEAMVKESEAFSRSVSHDLRIPLAVIDGYACLILSQAPSRPALDLAVHAEKIRESVQQMLSLINDLLTLSRATRAPVARSVLDLSALARVVCRELEMQSSVGTVDWQVADGMVVMADQYLMRVVLENLLGNSLKYTGRVQHPRVEFGVNERCEGRVFFVKDNGAGFDMATSQDRLFHSFQRFHSDSEFPGTGIGLATVKKVIQKHGGRVWAESARGCGATFFFTLPDTTGQVPLEQG